MDEPGARGSVSCGRGRRDGQERPKAVGDGRDLAGLHELWEAVSLAATRVVQSDLKQVGDGLKRGHSVGWFLLGLGCLTLGFAGWAIWNAFQQGNAAERTQRLKVAAVFGIGACMPFGLSAMYLFDIGANLTVSQVGVMMRAVGVVAALSGVWLAWYGPRASRQAYHAKFHGASLLLALQKTMTVLCVAMAIFLLFTGILFLTISYPFTAVSVVLGVLGLLGALVGIGAACVAAIVDDRLKMDAQIAIWRERHTATNENAIE